MKVTRFEYHTILTVMIVFTLAHIGCENSRDKYDPGSEIKKKNQEYNKTYKDKVDQIKETYSKSNYDSVENYIDEFKKIYPDSAKSVVIEYYTNKLDSINLVRAKYTLKINYVRTSEPNSAGGVDLNISFVNTSNSIIKYAIFVISPINAVDDFVKCTISDKSEIRFRVTGPIQPAQTKVAHWGSPWYNYSIVRASVSYIEIIYMDGRKVWVWCIYNKPYTVSYF